MTKEEAFTELKSEFAKYVIKYPFLCKRIAEEVSKHREPEKVLAIYLIKLNKLEDFIRNEF